MESLFRDSSSPPKELGLADPAETKCAHQVFVLYNSNDTKILWFSSFFSELVCSFLAVMSSAFYPSFKKTFLRSSNTTFAESGAPVNYFIYQHIRMFMKNYQ